MYAVKLTKDYETKMRIFYDDEIALANAVFERALKRCKRDCKPYLLVLIDNDTAIRIEEKR